MTDQNPLLRSPHFPGVQAGIADVARPGPAVPFGAGDGLRVGAAMAAARVGGCFWGEVAAASGGLLLAEAVPAAVDPWSAIDAADLVRGGPEHPVTLLALAAGKLVEDADGRPIGADEADRLLHAALVSGWSYRDVWRDRPTDVFSAIETLAGWRALIDANRRLGAAAGMAWWKRATLRPLLWRGEGAEMPFLPPASAIGRAAKGARAVAAWPSRVPTDFTDQAAGAGVRVVQVEDGFIRSAGLGSDLLPPLSIVVDEAGIYYDPGRPSDLEMLLSTHAFQIGLRERAAALRLRIVEGGIGKYGRDASSADVIFPDDRRIVLVAGQVEDDRSVILGGAGVAGNAELLQRARALEPDAFLIFRPHPDVEAGHRAGHVPDNEALRYADAISRGGSLVSLLARADAVHVLSSLTGFEALLRGRHVVVHGQPFYAGWGLTTDTAPAMLRRSRRLELDELVAATLILYPRYLDPLTGLPCPPEVLLDHLPEAAKRTPSPLVRLRRLQGRLRRALQRSYVAA